MPETIDLLVHVTHEAGVKVGGIGAVLNGLLGAEAYQKAVGRTIVVGPWNVDHPEEMARLFAPGNRMRLLYARHRGIALLPQALVYAFRTIEEAFNVGILYGMRPFGGVEHEVLLIDVTRIDQERIRDFRYFLWKHNHLDAARFEQDAEFRLFVALAEPAYAALYHLAQETPGRRVILAHEWMGVPLALAAMQRDATMWRTFFYAHEVATARLLVEENPGHDTRFYNVLRLALQENKTMEDLFGPQDHFFKHALLKQAAKFDGILAVGDRVVEELRFLGRDYAERDIDLVYNGVPAARITLADKKHSRALLQQYAHNLLDMTPDFIFSHVTRFVLSKALWRDVRVLEHLDRILDRAGETAVMFFLTSAEPMGRSPEQVFRWEQDYGWPVGHRCDNGDLIGQETDFFFQVLEPFNQRSRAIKAVLVNQFGWSQDRCGRRMPAEMGFMDLRHGADVEFGQSIYEPFGIAQVEPLSFGALCVPSNVCGAVGFVDKATSDIPDFPNFIIADYVTPPSDWQYHSAEETLSIDRYARDLIEIQRSKRVAEAIAARVPLNDKEMQHLIDSGHRVGQRMSWEVVAQDYLMPALTKIYA